MNAIETARTKITNCQQLAAELDGASKELTAHIDYLASRSKRLAHKAHHQDPSAIADKNKTDADLADAQAELADLKARQASNAARLASAKALLEGAKVAELLLMRDTAEAAGVRAWLDHREHLAAAEVAGKVHGLQRERANAAYRELAARRVKGVEPHIEVPLVSADKAKVLFQAKLATLEQKLSDPSNYDPARFVPEPTAATPAPAAHPQTSRPSVMSVDEYHGQFTNA